MLSCEIECSSWIEEKGLYILMVFGNWIEDGSFSWLLLLSVEISPISSRCAKTLSFSGAKESNSMSSISSGGRIGGSWYTLPSAWVGMFIGGRMNGSVCKLSGRVGMVGSGNCDTGIRSASSDGLRMSWGLISHYVMGGRKNRGDGRYLKSYYFDGWN